MDNQVVQAPVPQEIEVDEQHHAVALPPNWSLADMGKMGLLPPPAHVIQKVQLQTPEDFCAYVRQFQAEDNVLFANEETASFEAVLDYHSGVDAAAATRGECAHIALYNCPQSSNWQIWRKFSGKGLSQAEFAGFLEENLTDIATPPPAQLLEIALQLQVHKSAKFDSDLDLANGQRGLKYVEEIRGTSRTGSIEIPKVFKIYIPVFVDGMSFGIDARLKYRMVEGALTLWYELVRAEDVFREAVKQVTAKISEALPTTPLFRGRRA